MLPWFDASIIGLMTEQNGFEHKILNRAIQSRRIVILAYADAGLLDISGPLDLFSGASCILPTARQGLPAYQVDLVATSPGKVRTSSGVTLYAEKHYSDLDCENVDTLLIAGGLGFERAVNDHNLRDWIKHRAIHARRLVSICTGAFLLAEAGVLDGRRATTHWSYIRRMSETYSQIDVLPDALFVRDGHIYTSAGISSGMDLALALIEEDYGRDVALAVARNFVMFLKRPGGQSQFSVQLETQSSQSPVMQKLQAWIMENLDADLTVDVLARQADMSPRHFARVFRSELRITPAAFVEKARVETARRLLEETMRNVETISIDCGFKSPDRMRKAFLRQLGINPVDYRNRFKTVTLKE